MLSYALSSCPAIENNNSGNKSADNEPSIVEDNNNKSVDMLLVHKQIPIQTRVLLIDKQCLDDKQSIDFIMVDPVMIPEIPPRLNSLRHGMPDVLILGIDVEISVLAEI